MKNARAVLAGHRSAEKRYESWVKFWIGDVVLFTVLLTVAIVKQWHWFLCVLFGICVVTGAIRGVGDWSALMDRRKIIAQMEGADAENA